MVQQSLQLSVGIEPAPSREASLPTTAPRRRPYPPPPTPTTPPTCSSPSPSSSSPSSNLLPLLSLRSSYSTTTTGCTSSNNTPPSINNFHCLNLSLASFFLYIVFINLSTLSRSTLALFASILSCCFFCSSFYIFI